MLIRIQMVRGKSSCFLLWVILLICTSLVSCSGLRKSAEEVLLSGFVDPRDGKLDHDLAELLWIRCRQEFIRLKEDSEDSRCILEQGAIWTSPSTIKECNKLLQHSRQNLLKCAHKNTNSFHASGASVDDYIKNSIPLSQRTLIPRRSLLQTISVSPTPGSPAGSHAPAPAPSPEVTPDPDVPSPAPSSGSSFFPSIDSPPPPPPTAEDANSGPVSGPGNSSNGNRRTIVIAVTVTAAVTFVFAALFFLCCTKICRGARDRRNDERPLLSLSLSDYSIASSNKTFGYGSSIKEDNINSNAHLKSESLHVPLEKLLSDGDIAAKLPAESSAMSGNHNPLIPLPPGRMVNNSSLRPPSGRKGTVPPEPPASLRPPLSMAGPSLPPPPTPPPPKAGGSQAPNAPGPPPPPAPGMRPGTRPPPPPVLAPRPPPPGLAPRPPPPVPFGSKAPRPPPGLKTPSNEGASSEGDPDAPKAKLKPFFWDKVLANPDNSMVWHQIKSGSFQFNEEMIEALFGAAPADKNKNERRKESSSQDAANQFVQILEPKKAQNLSIMLRALNVTIEEVCDALYEGNELPVEFLQNLIKMQPTTEEELKLRMYSGDPSQLGQAERFLKQLVAVPFAFKRLEALVFMCTLQEEVTATKESFQTLEIACKELRSCRLFLKLLEAVLKTGNRMNDGTFRGGALAFKLDTLLKLADVKGTDGKTTLLHFVVQEIVRSEGVRAARTARESRSFSGVSVKTEDLLEEISSDTEDHFRDLGLQVVSRVSTELGNVKKAAALDADNLTGTVVKLGQALVQTREFLEKEMSSLDEDSGFHETLKSFVQNAEVDIKAMLEEEKRIMAVVKSAGDYFHGNTGKDEGLRLFVIVRDFLRILDRVCKEVGEAQKRRAKALKKEGSTASSASAPAPAPADNRMHPSPDLRQRLFPAIAERRTDDSDSSSDSET